MRILFITFYFPPFSSIGAVRTGKTVKYFNEMGHSVDVVTANNQPLAPTLDIKTGTAEVHYTNWFNINWPAELFSGGRKKIAAQGQQFYQRMIGPEGQELFCEHVKNMFREETSPIAKEKIFHHQ